MQETGLQSSSAMQPVADLSVEPGIVCRCSAWWLLRDGVVMPCSVSWRQCKLLASCLGVFGTSNF